MTTKETKLRIEPSLDDWLNAQAAIAGIAKTKYIIQVLEDLRSSAGHTQPQLSPKVSPVSPVDVSIYEEVAAIKARLTKLEEGTPQAIPNSTPQFYQGQEITGQSAKTYRLLWNSFEASQKIDRKEYYLSNELGIICRVLGTSKADKKKLMVVDCFQGKRVVINDDGTFLFMKSDGSVDCAYEGVGQALLEPTSPVESTKKPMPIEVNTLKGEAAKLRIASCYPKWIAGESKVLWFDGWLWSVESKDVIKKFIEYPKALFDSLPMLDEYNFHHGMSGVHAALERWNELNMLEHIERVLDAKGDSFFSKGSIFFEDTKYRRLLKTAQEAIAEHKSNLEKPISTVELSSDEIAIEATTTVQTPQNEIVAESIAEVAIIDKVGASGTEIVLSSGELVQRLAKNPGEAKTFGTTLTNVGGASRKAKAIIDWTSKHDPEGKSWLPEDATRETWVMQAAIAHTP